jgi:hypothetical protein
VGLARHTGPKWFNFPHLLHVAPLAAHFSPLWQLERPQFPQEPFSLIPDGLGRRGARPPNVRGGGGGLTPSRRRVALRPVAIPVISGVSTGVAATWVESRHSVGREPVIMS